MEPIGAELEARVEESIPADAHSDQRSFRLSPDIELTIEDGRERIPPPMPPMPSTSHPPPPPEGSRTRKRKRSSRAGRPSQTKRRWVEKQIQPLGDEPEEPRMENVMHWSRYGYWPESFFDHYVQKEGNAAHGKKMLRTQRGRAYFGNFSSIYYVLARQKYSPSVGHGDLDPSLAARGAQSSREAKQAAVYTLSNYPDLLENKGIFMRESNLGVRGVADPSDWVCARRKMETCTVPSDSLFNDDVFAKAHQNLCNGNEAMVIRDIGQLIVPSAQTLATRGAEELLKLAESVNESWDSCISVFKSHPQPNYTVGFARHAFSDWQLERLEPFIGDVADGYESYFTATSRIYFPFLTCEVRCGDAGLDIADRRNAHSMAIAGRAMVELWKSTRWSGCTNWKKQVHREIFGWSVSHDHTSVRIYGHYTVVDGDDVTYFRHPVRDFSFTAGDGAERWTAYKFIRNIYDVWVPKKLKWIGFAIWALPYWKDVDDTQRDTSAFSSATTESKRSYLPAMDGSIPRSMETAGSAKPEFRLATKLRRERDTLQEENQILQDQVTQLLRQRQEQHARYEDRKEQRRQEHEQQMQRQHEEHREEMDEQYKELVTLQMERQYASLVNIPMLQEEQPESPEATQEPESRGIIKREQEEEIPGVREEEKEEEHLVIKQESPTPWINKDDEDEDEDEEEPELVFIKQESPL